MFDPFSMTRSLNQILNMMDKFMDSPFTAASRGMGERASSQMRCQGDQSNQGRDEKRCAESYGAEGERRGEVQNVFHVNVGVCQWNHTSQNSLIEDLNYLWKLGAGSIVGAAAIKYGSVLFPDITRPNLLEAIIIISSPIIVAVLLLIRQSHLQQ